MRGPSETLDRQCRNCSAKDSGVGNQIVSTRIGGDAYRKGKVAALRNPKFRKAKVAKG